MITGESQRGLIVRILRLLYKSLNSFFQNSLQYRRIKSLDNLYRSLLYPKYKILNPKQHKSIDDLFNKYIKIRHSSHLFYTQKTGVFYREYIPDSIWRNQIDMYYNNRTAANIIDNKCFYPKMFTGIKQPEMITYRLNNFWYDKNGAIIDKAEAMQLIMESDDCFIKQAVNSFGGLGVFYFKPGGGETLEELVRIIDGIAVDLVVQARIIQCSELASINNDCVNTIRIVSLLRMDGSVKIYSSVLRMGIKGAKVDNASSGGISVGINNDGKLKDIAFSNTGKKYYEHPSTHVKFGDYTVPNFIKMKEEVVRIHLRFPQFRLIGWDIACDESKEPVLVEANLCDSELDFHQLNNGPIFGDDTESILKEVFGKK